MTLTRQRGPQSGWYYRGKKFNGSMNLETDSPIADMVVPVRLSRQHRRHLTRELHDDPVLAAAWVAHKRVNAHGGRRLVLFWRHWRIERASGATLRQVWELAGKWVEQAGKPVLAGVITDRQTIDTREQGDWKQA